MTVISARTDRTDMPFSIAALRHPVPAAALAMSTTTNTFYLVTRYIEPLMLIVAR